MTTAEEIVMNPNTSQYRATAWLSQDPMYYYYSEDRIIQRWVLAVFAYSWVASSQLETQQRQQRLDGLPQGWLTYTDECTWFTSSIEVAPCDENGMYRRIDIQDMMLGGYLPPELSLLSNSLSECLMLVITYKPLCFCVLMLYHRFCLLDLSPVWFGLHYIEIST